MDPGLLFGAAQSVWEWCSVLPENLVKAWWGVCSLEQLHRIAVRLASRRMRAQILGHASAHALGTLLLT